MRKADVTRPTVYICIPVHNDVALTLKCLESISSQSYQSLKTILVDDGSVDDTSKLVLEKYPDTIVLQGNGELWWTGATHMAVEHALSICTPDDCIYTLNNDTELFENTLMELVEMHFQYPNAIIGTLNLIYESPEKIELSAFLRSDAFMFGKRLKKLNLSLPKLDGKKMLPVYALSGKGVLIPVHVFRSIGNYSHKMLPHYHADTEFSIRAFNRGYKIYLNTAAKLYSHHKRTGIGTSATVTDMKTFFKSFKTIKSPHHFKSLVNFNRLVFGKKYWLHLFWDILFISGGYLKRNVTRYIH